MARFVVTFYGRKAGALGVCDWHKVEVTADNEAAACLKVYDTHEHISVRDVREVG